MVLPTAFREAGRGALRLAALTTFGIGGTPEFLFRPASEAQASWVVVTCRRHGVPLRLLGGGSNLLVDDRDLDGAVLSTSRLRGAAVDAERVEVGAGSSFVRLVGRAPAWQIPVLSGCSGIPGTVGGAVAMNAGGRFGTVSEALTEIAGIDERGAPFRRRVRSSDFAYRESLLEGRLVTRAAFRRDASLDPDRERGRLRAALEEKRQRQPLGARSAGCVFRNPSVAGRRVSAGRLIDEAGCKGRRVGGASVSAVHANFIVNEDGATAEDVRALIRVVREAVSDRHGVDLELEVRIWS